MLRLVKTDLATPGKLDPSDRAPSLPVNVGTPHAFPFQRRHLGLEIVTHKIEFVPIILAGILFWMKRGLRRRQGKNQPSLACIHGLESKDVSEEGAIRLRVSAVHDYVRTEDHELYLRAH